MRTFIKILGIISIISCLALLVHLAIVVKTIWLLALLPITLSIIFVIHLGSNDSYWLYTKKEDTAFNELEAEKQAYIDARKDLEATSLLLGNILVEKKENY